MEPRRSTPELRTEIARLDREILERLEARARASKEIRSRAESEPAPDVTDRDALTALSAAATGDLPSESLYAIFSAIRASARALEQAPRVAYLGPEGGFSHVLGRTHFGAGGAFIECPSVREALEEVARGRAACAVFPFESSADGLVQASVTALTDTELVIVGARTLSVTMFRATVSNQPRTDPLPFTRASGWRHARTRVSWTTSSAAARSPVNRVAYASSARPCSS
jgi:chorismate mutase/prephenate dehydratase